MTYRETCILLPCHSLEDFPMHYEGAEADGLLAAWTSLWHPLLLAATGTAPTWYRSDGPPEDHSGRLIVAPGVSLDEIPAGFVERAEAEGACVILGNLPREQILERALEPLATRASSLDADLVADFLALGYCFLQVELLTRQMRYSTNLDEIHFYGQVTQAATAAVDGDHDQAKEKLTACFDLLAEERDHYYAVDAYVVDLTLLAPTTLGASLQHQLEAELPVNLMMAAELLDTFEQSAPESFQAVKKGLAGGYVGLVGGADSSSRPLLETCETVRQRLCHGLDQFQSVLKARPQVFGTWRFGLSSIHPQLLRQLGYLGAFHVSLSDGRVPEGSQIKIRWEGLDHTSLDAIAKNPLDASEPGTFLGLASRLGETMDMDHVATICLAHWPGHVCTWYHDLRRVARYGAMLGRFITVEDYFRETDYPGQLEQFQADQYRSPYLSEAAATQVVDPISTSVRYWRRRAVVDAAKSLGTVATLIGNLPVDAIDALVDEVDATASGAGREDLDVDLNDRLQQAAEQVAQQIPRESGDSSPAYMVLNPSCLSRRALLDLPELDRLPPIGGLIYSAASDGGHNYVVVDVPPLGFAYVGGTPNQTARDQAGSSVDSVRSGWLPGLKGKLRGSGGGPVDGPASAVSSKRLTQLLAEENRLCNEFFEIHVNPDTGAIQAIYQYNKRGNLLSQQLAVRNPVREGQLAAGDSRSYSVMAADRIEITAATTTMGEITTEGRLLDDQGQALARYRQRYQVWRGSRVLRLSIELEPLAQLGADPWDSYYACRFAWASETALLWRGVGQMHERGEAKRMEAPCYIDIDDAGRHTTIMTGGLPYHRRTGRRMLDSLLIVRGEQARKFELGIGINVKYPLHEATNLLTPTPALLQSAGPPKGSPSSWLFHLECRNVHATDWSPLVTQGQVTGVRVRLLESTGRPAKGRLRGFRPFGSARRVDFSGDNLGDCTVRDGGVVLELGANEWVELEAKWS